MLFIRKPMETYRNQSQNFMGIKPIHVWYIPTVWCFWKLSTGVLWESSLSMYGPLANPWDDCIFTDIYKIDCWYAIIVQLTHPQLRNCLSVSWSAQNQSCGVKHCVSHHNTWHNSTFQLGVKTPYSAWRRIVARIDQPLVFGAKIRFTNPSELIVRVITLSLHIDIIYTLW